MTLEEMLEIRRLRTSSSTEELRTRIAGNLTLDRRNVKNLAPMAHGLDGNNRLDLSNTGGTNLNLRGTVLKAGSAPMDTTYTPMAFDNSGSFEMPRTDLPTAGGLELSPELAGVAATGSLFGVGAQTAGLDELEAGLVLGTNRTALTGSIGEREANSRTQMLRDQEADINAKVAGVNTGQQQFNPLEGDVDFGRYEGTGVVTSFSGQDIEAMAYINSFSEGKWKPRMQTFMNLQTISISVFREKQPVRALGYITEKGKTRGTRTIAGSFVFTMFDRDTFFNALRESAADNTSTAKDNLAYGLPDQLPKFDLVISMANEYGVVSEMALYGVDIISTGQVMSAENLITEQTVQYTAQYMKVMRPGGYTNSFTSKPQKNASGRLRAYLNRREQDVTENLAF